MIRDVLKSGGRAVTAWCNIPSTVTAEIVAQQGFDCIGVDLQHGLIDYQRAVEMIQVINAYTTNVVARIPWNDPAITMKVLDAGYMGVICPMVNNRRDAELLVGNCAYPPMGRRSFGPIRAGRIYRDKPFQNAVEDVVVIAMIETREGLDNVEEIVSTPGIDGIYVGPGDLSVSFGDYPSVDPTNPAVAAGIETARKAARARGRFAGIACDSAALAKRRFDQGFDMATIGMDHTMFGAALAGALKAARTLD